MKHQLIFLLALGCFFVCSAQQTLKTSTSTESSLSHFQVGLQFGQAQQDFGIGLNLTSPRFFNRHVAIRLAGNVQWLQNISTTSLETDWNAYGSYKLGINGIGGFITPSIFVYGEGGLVMITPNKNFSDKSTVTGSYGLMGFEFMINKHIHYFIELGGIGTGAIAEKSLYKPIYDNGFTVSVGIRTNFH